MTWGGGVGDGLGLVLLGMEPEAERLAGRMEETVLLRGISEGALERAVLASEREVMALPLERVEGWGLDGEERQAYDEEERSTVLVSSSARCSVLMLSVTRFFFFPFRS